jgi:hypothetical protein
MIGTRARTLQIFMSAQSVLAADVPSQRFPSITTIEANHKLVTHRLPHRYSGSPNFLGLNTLDKLSKRSMHRCDEF